MKTNEYKFPVRDSGLNPFLTNPVHAVVSDKKNFGNLLSFHIDHAIHTSEGLIVFGMWQNDETKGYTQYNLSQGEMRIANTHEAARFEMMLKMLKISL